MQFDINLFQALHSLVGVSSILDFLGIFLARFLAYFLIVILVVLFVIESNWRKKIYDSALIVLSVIFSRGIIVEGIRVFYERLRPPVVLGFEALIPVPHSPAFPSGHASFFFALATALFFIHRKWGIWFLAGSLVMGIARVFVGVHWPMDIVGGIAVGVVSAFIAYILLDYRKANMLYNDATNRTMGDDS